ncbi:MAG: hypothetical protein IT323_16745 [Anaerolineae bacterium]|nr:hypothetical protein [Anaerolineae bacterium]
MGGSGDLDFLSQIPLQIILAPIVFGALYIVAMVFIFRRAAERRRKAREAKNAALGLDTPAMNVAKSAPVPDSASAGAARSRLGRLSGAGSASEAPGGAALPEPDLALLLMAAPGAPAAAVASMAAPSAGAMPVAPPDAPAQDDYEEEDAAEYTPVAREEAEMATDPGPSLPADLSDAVEVMRIFRDLSDGALIIRIGDRYLRSADEFQNPELLRRFTTIVRDLTALASQLSVLPEAPVGLRDTNTLPPVAQAMAASGVPGSLKVRTGVENEPIKPAGLFRRVPKPEGPAETVRGVAEAVEEFLQFKLAADPKYVTRSIHIRQAHDGGLRIEVDGHYYTAISDVVDADVRDLLQAVMKEWEARQ